MWPQLGLKYVFKRQQRLRWWGLALTLRCITWTRVFSSKQVKSQGNAGAGKGKSMLEPPRAWGLTWVLTGPWLSLFEVHHMNKGKVTRKCRGREVENPGAWPGSWLGPDSHFPPRELLSSLSALPSLPLSLSLSVRSTCHCFTERAKMRQCDTYKNSINLMLLELFPCIYMYLHIYRI